MPIPTNRRQFLKLGLLAAVSEQMAPLQSWSFTPQALPHRLPDPENLAYFNETEVFLKRRIQPSEQWLKLSMM
jgi:hypothetical protein